MITNKLQRQMPQKGIKTVPKATKGYQKTSQKPHFGIAKATKRYQKIKYHSSQLR
jgi:hypothetical protein